MDVAQTETSARQIDRQTNLIFLLAKKQIDRRLRTETNS